MSMSITHGLNISLQQCDLIFSSCKSDWLLRRVYGLIHTAAAVYMTHFTQRELHFDVMKSHYFLPSYMCSIFFPLNFQTSVSNIFLASTSLHFTFTLCLGIFPFYSYLINHSLVRSFQLSKQISNPSRNK